MAKKYKLTGCAKFFIFFIIAAPIAYIGASYYNGQDPIKEVKEFVQSFTSNDSDQAEDFTDKNVNAKKNTDSGSVYQEMELKDLEIKSLKNDLKDCEALNDKQKQVIDAQKLEIKNLEQRVSTE